MDRSRIEALVDDLQPVKPPGLAAYLFRIAAALVVASVFVLALAHPRPDLAEAVAREAFWLKQTLLALPLVIGAVAVWRLARPAGQVPRFWVYAVFVLAFAILIALAWPEFAGREPGAELLQAGPRGLHCLLVSTAASLPMLILGLQWLRTMAPTRIAAASRALGLLAGGVGTSAYALHCPYESAGYIAVWYGLSLLAVLLAGRYLLPRRLVW